MPLLPFTAVLLALLPWAVTDILREPEYSIVRDGDRWVVRKPSVRGQGPVTISRHRDRSAAESHKRSLPPLRLNRPFVRFDPATYERMTIADWTLSADAKEITADVLEILRRFAPAAPQTLLQATPVYMARLYGATGHTAQESTDSARFVIYLDPFRATGRLHAAATLIHELTHLERYRARGSHANRSAAVMSKEDFVLLGLADEFAAYEAEADLVQSFLNQGKGQDIQHATRHAILDPELNWPLAVGVMLGSQGPIETHSRLREARRQVGLDLARTAAAYWEARHTEVLEPVLQKKILTWYKQSTEWQEIAAQRAEWQRAEVDFRRSVP